MIRWLKDKAVNAWYGLGAWMTVTLWGLFDGMAQPGHSLQAAMVDCHHELVLPPGYVFPDHPVYPRKPIVFDDLHLCEPHRSRDLLGLPPVVIRVRPELPQLDRMLELPSMPDVYEIPGKKASRRKAAVAKKRKSVKALAPKRKPKAGAKTVTRKKRA